MTPRSRSLMDFIQAPVLVGDPDGRAVYVNPTFEEQFGVTSEEAAGKPLANLFEGGGREAVLLAVAQVCDGSAGSAARFKLRVEDRGYAVVASPVEADGGRVGVILLLTDEPPGENRLQTFRREIVEPLDELDACLQGLADAGLSADQLVRLQEGATALERMRKWASAVAAGLTEDCR
ncbi:MAG: PAS domain-containing protein [Myxococcota bacterium]